MQFSFRKGLIISLKPEGWAAFAEKTDGSRTIIARIQMEFIPVPFALIVMLTLWWKRCVGSRFHLSSGIGHDFFHLLQMNVFVFTAISLKFFQHILPDWRGAQLLHRIIFHDCLEVKFGGKGLKSHLDQRMKNQSKQRPYQGPKNLLHRIM